VRQTVGDLGERALIERIRARVPSPPDWVLVGIGDDAAVLEPAPNTLDVQTTDALIEGIHFDRAYVSAFDVGHKALAVNLSDLAAMGAMPRAALLSLGLPASWPVADFDDLLGGLLTLAAQYRVALVGGNIARSPGPLVVNVTAVGSVKPRRVLCRGGARPGDDLYVTGSVGAAVAGFASCRARAGRQAASGSSGTGGGPGTGAEGESPAMARSEERFRRPDPRVRFGVLLGRNRAASACVDLSDGLADAVRQVAGASGTGAVVDASLVPVNEGARQWFEGRGEDPLEAALAGGEDYELLFTLSPRRRRLAAAVASLAGDLAVTRIGTITADPRVVLRRDGRDSLLPEGFVHFR